MIRPTKEQLTTIAYVDAYDRALEGLTDAHNLLMRIENGDDDFFSITDWDEKLGHIEHVLNLDTERARVFRAKYDVYDHQSEKVLATFKNRDFGGVAFWRRAKEAAQRFIKTL